MYTAPTFVFTIFSYTLMLCHHHILNFVNGGNTPSPAASYHIGDAAINCGSIGNSIAFDGREWIGDAGSKFMSSLQLKGKSRSSTAAYKSISADPVPYMTARISATQFHYTFRLNPGQKFIRLHFYPASYRGFEKSEDFFTVKAGPFTLVHNYSASLAAETLGVKFFVKEYCLNVEENTELNITFSPCQSSRKTYAFVNGIEIISMPTGLYYTPHGDFGARIVGQDNRFILVDNSTALELIQRLNTGGGSISSVEDSGMFRKWNGDANYLLETRVHQVNHPAHGIKYINVPAHVAPPRVYRTSWKTDNNVRAHDMYSFRWKIPLDLGFGYLVRLHFCEVDPGMAESGKREFSVLINDQIVETNTDIVSWSGGSGIPVYRDYLVMMKGDKGGKRDLLIALHSAEELLPGLGGLEIFKLSNPDNSLATPNPVVPKRSSRYWTQKIHDLFVAFGQRNVIATCITILLISLNIMVFNLRHNWEASILQEKDTPPVSIDPSFRRFSLAEIISATQNFSDASVLGRGGFGKVYKGFISCTSETVAIKRLNPSSKQGAREFWTEIETLSKFQNIHLVSLIGYCNECQEMILVYEYMSRGTLADNLYRVGRNGKDCAPLSWEQRLRICIGAARGLEYLHRGTQHGVIHRDVKDSNILLDDNFIAKISDFGLSKLEMTSQSKSYISTKVKGTFGYLDPEYCMTKKLTTKSDVYAFGVVLLVVLSGRPAVDHRNPEEPQSLLLRFRECMAEEEVDGIVDPSLQGKILPNSLREFVKTVENCLCNQPKKRPTMTQVVTSLELALEQQENKIPEDVLEHSQLFDDITGESMQFIQSPAPPPTVGESVNFSPKEGIVSKPIEDPSLSPSKGKDLHSREDSTTIRKPFWGWPWKAVWSRGKPIKKSDLVLSNVSSPRSSIEIQPNDSVPRSSIDGQANNSLSRFSMEDIRAATDNFSHGFVIVGGHMKACKGFIQYLHKSVTIYNIDVEKYGNAVTEICHELERLSQLRHPNLQSLIGYCHNEPENQMFIIYDHIGSDTLHNHLYGNRNAPVSWKHRLHICIGVAQGLDYLHKCTGEKINHYDLSSTNILLDESWNPKISNFGLSKLYQVKHELRTPKITKAFDYKSGKPEESDVCSLGLVLLEVLCSRRMNLDEYQRTLILLLKKSIKSRTFHLVIDSTLKGEIAATCLAEFLQILFSCLLVHEEQRPRLGDFVFLGDVVEKLKFSLELQEEAEEKKQDINGEGSINDGFSLEDIYQEISYLGADNDNVFYQHNFRPKFYLLNAADEGIRSSANGES